MKISSALCVKRKCMDGQASEACWTTRLICRNSVRVDFRNFFLAG